MLITVFLWRLFFGTFAVRVVGRDRLLLVGSSPLLGDIARHVERSSGTWHSSGRLP